MRYSLSGYVRVLGEEANSSGHGQGGFDALFSRPGSLFSYAARHIAWTARATSDTSVTSIQDGFAVVVAASGGE